MGLERVPTDFFKVNVAKNAKYSRITALEPLLTSGRLFFLNSLPDLEELYKEFTQYPGGAHDDIPDAISHLLRVLPTSRSAEAPDYREAYQLLKQKQLNELIFGTDFPTVEPEPEPELVEICDYGFGFTRQV